MQGEIELLNKSDPLQQIITKRIGYGVAQLKLSRPLYLLLFSEGCQSIVLGLLLPQLSIEWQLGVFQKSLLITLVYTGVTIGSYLQTYSDRFGRYAFVTWDAIIQTAFGLLSCICTSFNAFLFCRFFYGVGIGIVLPLSGSYLAQITPGQYRATILSSSRVCWSAGALFTCFLGWIFLGGGQHWRILLFLICIPGMYALYDHWKNGRQSLRYMWSKKDSKGVKQMLDYMASQNNREPIPLQQIQNQIQQRLSEDPDKSSIKALFNQKYYQPTIILLVAWFSVCFIYYGVMLLLPSILARHSTFTINYQYFVLSVVSATQIFSFWVARYAMDAKDLGRKKTLYLSFSIIVISTLIILMTGEDNQTVLFIIFILLKLFVTMGFMVLYPYTAEIYETMLRGQAMGVMSCSGRIATTILGITGVSALQWMGGNGLYVLNLLLSSISAVLVFKMPYDTLGRPLDL